MQTTTRGDSFSHKPTTFSKRLELLSPSRLEEIEDALEDIFSDARYLSEVKHLQIASMQTQIDKIQTKYLVNPRAMSALDEMRILRFQERIDAIYEEKEPTSRDFHYAESLMHEREKLLDL